MYSLRTIFLVVAVTALWVAALGADSQWLAASFNTLTVIILLWALLEHKKPFWYAFTVFGIGYLVSATFATSLTNDDLLPQAIANKWLTYEMVGSPSDPDVLNPYKTRVAKAFACQAGFALLLGLCAGLVNEWRTKKGGP